MRKNMKKVLFIFALAVINMLLFSALPAKAAVGVNVDYHTQEEIKAYIQKNGATLEDALTFETQPQITAPYAAGRLSHQTLDSAIKMMNQIRYIAGLSYDVKLSDNYNQLTQAAALTNYVNRQLSHYPVQPEGMDDDLYAYAYTGASSSNIAWASWRNRSINETIVFGWMEDGDSSNIDRVGHRRWILNPKMGATGFGSVSGSNGTYAAMYAFDRTNTSADEYGVMWPAQNMPIEYFNNEFPWSISMGTRVDKSAIEVTLIRKNDGKVWNFSSESADGEFYVDNQSYGQSGCIIFDPEGVASYEDGDSYNVSITGLSGGTVSYTVNFFTIKKKLSNAIVTLEKETYAYNGTRIMPQVTVQLEDKVLTEDVDYNVYYTDNYYIGTGTVTIIGAGEYTGRLERTFTITKADQEIHLSWPNVTVRIGETDKLVLSCYGKVQYESENPQIATVSEKGIVTGISEGTTNIIVSTEGNEYYNPAEIKVPVTVKRAYTNEDTEDVVDTEEILPGKSIIYSVTTKNQKAVIKWMEQYGVSGYDIYMSDSENGTYEKIDTIQTPLVTTCTTEVLTKNKVYYFKVRWYKIVNGQEIYGEYSDVQSVKIKAVSVNKVKLNSVKIKNKKAVMKWKKQNNVSGYVIYMAKDTQSNYKKIKTVKTASITQYTTGVLKKGTTYFFKIRAYKVVNGKRVYGAYSQIKKVKRNK